MIMREEEEMEVQREVSGGAKVLSVLLCILAVIPLVVGLGIMSLSGVFSESSLRKIIHSSELGETFTSASDRFREALQDNLGVESEDMEDLNDMLEDVVVDMTRYGITGQGEPIRVSSVMKELKKQVKKLEKSADIEIDEEQLEEIEEYLEEANKEFKDYVGNTLEADPEVKLVRNLLSGRLVLIFYAAAAVLFVIVFLLMMSRPDKVLTYIGVTGIVSAVFGFALGGLLLLAKSQAGSAEKDLALVVGMMGNNALMYACIYVIVGVVLIIGGKAIRKNRMGDAVNA